MKLDYSRDKLLTDFSKITLRDRYMVPGEESPQEAFARGDLSRAKNFAKRAQSKLKRGSSGWLRADDIVSYTPPKL